MSNNSVDKIYSLNEDERELYIEKITENLSVNSKKKENVRRFL